MLAISLTEPWGMLVPLGFKMWETRSWQSPYRGTLAIQAAKGFPKSARELCDQSLFKSALMTYQPFVDGGWAALPTGCVVATCDLVNIYPTERFEYEAKVPNGQFWTDGGPQDKIYIGEKEWCFGDYSPGRFAWQMKNIHALPEPLPVRGALGLWNWEPPKGQRGGFCNVTSCQKPGAVFFNKSTRAYYCPACAERINHTNREDAMQMFGSELCVLEVG